MTTFYLRLVLLPIVLLTAVLLIIRSQPYDDHELRELLLPTDCPAPCFMGIQPGVTTMDEAVKLLEASGWVKNIEWAESINDGILKDIGYVNWLWSNQAPSWFLQDSINQIEIRTNSVAKIMFDTNISVGEIRLILGQPDAEVVDFMEDQTSDGVFYMAFYDPFGLSVSSVYPCVRNQPFRGKVSMLMSPISDSTGIYNDSLTDVLHVC